VACGYEVPIRSATNLAQVNVISFLTLVRNLFEIALKNNVKNEITLTCAKFSADLVDIQSCRL